MKALHPPRGHQQTVPASGSGILIGSFGGLVGLGGAEFLLPELGLGTRTNPVAIYLGFESNLGVALILSVVLIAVSIIVLGATRQLEKRRSQLPLAVLFDHQYMDREGAKGRHIRLKGPLIDQL